jgi:Fe-S cluster biogenesis protein NfuA/nitrite reductase/ring-hydroxylating ferredoxin subunit
MTETETPEGTAEQLLGEMLDLHGEGLARILAAEPGLRDRVAGDPVVASMLLIHGLHPVPLEERVATALDRVRPYLASHGGGVELVSLDGGIARLRLQGSCNGCSASASTLELAIERSLEEGAPDLLGIEVEGVNAQQARTAAKPLPLLGAEPAWAELETSPAPGDLVASPGLVVANVAGTLLAYRDACAGCGASLAGGALDDGVLACPACRREYALPLAGRSLGPEDLQLQPVPLLEEAGSVRVAVGA